MDPNLIEAIYVAKANIESFHTAQLGKKIMVETMPGVVCWQESKPIDKVGIYIPGGSAPLFSTVLMLAVPARIAGCGEIILCSPPDITGHINPAILYTAQLCGIDKIYKIGGAQAIAAMAYGTKEIPKVIKIFGPCLSLIHIFFTDVHKYVRKLEEVVIKTLADYSISSFRNPDYTGVWVLSRICLLYTSRCV